MQGGPRTFSQSFTTSDLLDRRRSPVAYRTVTLCGRPFQSVRLGSRRRTARSRGLIRVRSPLLTESRLISFPPGTEMFQFPGFAPDGLCIQPPVLPAGCPVTMGCPIRRSPDQSLFGGSPELIAAYNVLLRLCTPRHPPYTLSSLTTFVNGCGQHRTSLQSERTEFGTAAAGPQRDRRRPADSSSPADTCTSTYELVTEPAGRRLAPPTGTRFRGPPGTRPVPGGSRPPPDRSLEPTGIEPAASALQTRRSPD